jgi:hypothetical protein
MASHDVASIICQALRLGKPAFSDGPKVELNLTTNDSALKVPVSAVKEGAAGFKLDLADDF